MDNPGTMKPTDKFNVLLLWTDQQRADTLRCMGQGKSIMPRIDELAEDCTVFTRAYCTSPVCTPSRGSVLTGLMPHAHGAVSNNVPLHAHVRCLPELLADVDTFATCYAGKWHLGDELFAQHGFEAWHASEDGYQGGFSSGRDRSARSAFYHRLVARGYLPDPKDPWLRDWSMKLPVRDSKPAFIVDNTLDFLSRNEGRRWVASANTLEPHHPLMGPCADAFSPQDLPHPPNLCHEAAEAPLFVKVSQARWRTYGFEDFHLRDAQSWKQMGAHYWGQCRHVDGQYGRLLDHLRQSGQYDNTLIIYCSDHGEMMGEHGLWGKGVPYEGSSHVPLMIKLPGQRGQRRHDLPVSLADIVPTVLEAAGLTPTGLHGRSLLSACHGDGLAGRDEMLVWTCLPGSADKLNDAAKGIASEEAMRASLACNWRTLLTAEGWKYTLTDHGEQMLHHVLEDPHELHDRVAESPSTLVDSLQRRLRAVCERVDDAFFERLAQ